MIFITSTTRRSSNLTQKAGLKAEDDSSIFLALYRACLCAHDIHHVDIHQVSHRKRGLKPPSADIVQTCDMKYWSLVATEGPQAAVGFVAFFTSTLSSRCAQR
ncbi:hypothetical protein KP509_10G045500 [Ceratopteris richardii]|uniref:Uncharacterized protein n=1 Tax=Ceratopteris richardii TaxID=49495 RepID=A0A8T2U0Y7_CERRI|nr:hypothetical protein KP509_10G045500 [Ceratopteris richardii]